MPEFDLYVNPRKPAIGLYVKKGAGLPDLDDARDWKREGTVGANEVTPATLEEISANGHALVDLDLG